MKLTDDEVDRCEVCGSDRACSHDTQTDWDQYEAQVLDKHITFLKEVRQGLHPDFYADGDIIRFIGEKTQGEKE